MKIVPERNDKGKLILIVSRRLPMLDARFANHPVIRGAERAGLRISEIETRDVYFHQHALQRQGWSIYNGAGSLCCIIAGPFPFALRHLFFLGGAIDGSCAAAASFPIKEHRR